MASSVDWKHEEKALRRRLIDEADSLTHKQIAAIREQIAEMEVKVQAADRIQQGIQNCIARLPDVQEELRQLKLSREAIEEKIHLEGPVEAMPTRRNPGDADARRQVEKRREELQRSMQTIEAEIRKKEEEFRLHSVVEKYRRDDATCERVMETLQKLLTHLSFSPQAQGPPSPKIIAYHCEIAPSSASSTDTQKFSAQAPAHEYFAFAGMSERISKMTRDTDWKEIVKKTMDRAVLDEREAAISAALSFAHHAHWLMEQSPLIMLCQDMGNYEMALTAAFSLRFSQFIAKVSPTFLALHQAVSHINKRSACPSDIVVMESKFKKLPQGRPMNIEFRLPIETEDQQVLHQALTYAHASMTNPHDGNGPIAMLYALADRQQVQLYGFWRAVEWEEGSVELHPKIHYAQLHKCQWNNLNEIAALFLTCAWMLPSLMTTCDIGFPHVPIIHKLMLCDKYKRYGRRLLGCKNKVFKIFDLEKDAHRKPNVEAIRACWGDTTAGVHKVPNTQIEVLMYPDFEGTHQPTNPEDFASICEQLHNLHKAGFVHGDIRRANMLFPSSNSGGGGGGGDDDDSGVPSVARIIDFDYARSAGGGESEPPRYPKTFNNNVAGRHPDAAPGKEMQQSHDLYSLLAIIQTAVVDVDGGDVLGQVCKAIQEGNLQLAVELLRTSSAHMAINSNIPHIEVGQVNSG